jgi:hypothetical protein
LDAADANDMQGADHYGVPVICQSHDDLMPDYGGILRVLDPKDLSAAAMDLERAKGRVLQELAYLFEHRRRLQCGQCTCKCVELRGHHQNPAQLAWLSWLSQKLRLTAAHGP